MIARWDNAPHHPHVSTHPFHKHNQDGSVAPSRPMDITRVLLEMDDVLDVSANGD